MKRKTMRPQHVDEHSILRMLTARAHAAQSGRCYHCGKLIGLDKTTGDHLIARYQGGKTKAGNIVASCGPCNHHRNPETNRCGGRFDITIGDPAVRSPFEVLRNWGTR